MTRSDPRWKVRQDNLNRILEDRFGGKLRALADAIDRSESYVWQLCRGKQPRFGEDARKHIEQALGLEHGALDRGLDAPQPAPAELTEAELNRIWLAYPKVLKAALVRTVSAAQDVAPKPPPEGNKPRPKEHFAPAIRRRRKRAVGKQDAG